MEDTVKTIVSALSSNAYKESVDKHEELLKKLQEIKTTTNADFISILQIAQDDFSDVIQHLYEIPSQPNDAIVRYIVNGIYEEFHENRIIKLEGSICCSDKASYITKVTLKALKHQENLPLNNYLSLACVKDTDDAIQLFKDWYSLNNYKSSQESTNQTE